MSIDQGDIVARHKAAKFEARKLNEDELLALFDQSLSALSHLASIYDGGFHPIALQMATEVHKLLTQDGPAMRLRGMRKFTTVNMGDQSRMLNAMHKLVGARIGGQPPKLDFIADFQMADPADLIETPSLSFKEWWNRDVIYRASAAIPGSPPGMIPVNGTPSVPFNKRETINRRDFVALLRNKLGAHQDGDLPILLDQLEEARCWGEFVCHTPEGILSTEDGTLTTGATIMAAMMRQIAHEVLVAYDRDDPPSQSGEPHPS